MITKVKIFGERCSGTNYLTNLIKENFKVQIIEDNYIYGQKHFFGFHHLENSDNTLFICIIRDYHSWLNSLWKEKWHISQKQRQSISHFLNAQHWSYYDKKEYSILKYGKEIMEDRNIYTKERYKNIFELRYTKIKWMQETLPTLVKNTILIRYEDLLYHFKNTMDKIYKKGLPLLSPSTFPKNYFLYKTSSKPFIKEDKNIIKRNKIQKHPSFQLHLEKKLGYL